IATMTPPIETPNKPADSYHHSHAPLNERILSSMKRRSAASHPWHDRSVRLSSELSLLKIRLWKTSMDAIMLLCNKEDFVKHVNEITSGQGVEVVFHFQFSGLEFSFKSSSIMVQIHLCAHTLC
ncbi:hypothetical protein Tco_0048220, partial [Tanacetum coccineum]